MTKDTITHDERTLTITEIMTPDMANFGGKVHGGAILKLMDRVAYACAARYSKHYCVTLSFDHVLFARPIEVGEMVSIFACVNYVGTSSMEIGLRVVSENITSGSTQHTNTSYVTMVAVDDDHKPIKIKPLALNTDTEKRRFKNAEFRKQLRREYYDKHQAGKGD
jgi:acyl-CoA hydrolase